MFKILGSDGLPWSLYNYVTSIIYKKLSYLLMIKWLSNACNIHYDNFL